MPVISHLIGTSKGVEICSRALFHFPKGFLKVFFFICFGGVTVENDKTELMNVKKAKMMSGGISGCFLVIHVLLLCLFYRYDVIPMVWFNVFSIVFYTAMLAAVLKEHIRYYSILVYLEVVAHMSLAVYYTGWSSGFQVTLIGMNIVLAYSEYIAWRLKVVGTKAFPGSLIGMAAYLILCVVDHYHAAAYPLPANIAFMLQFAWGVTVFVISIYSLTTFVHLTTKSEEILTHEADHDQLTQLPNRYYMTDYLNELHEKSGMEGYWLAIMDIDDFKVINDTLGHNCGDAVLKEVASILQEQCAEYGPDQVACRWGGEEFLIVGKESGSREKDIDSMKALCRKFRERHFAYDNKTLNITMTIGMAFYRPNMNLREWIEVADNRLYDGKRSGKNKVVA